jgi:low affinity Fe/Cu permease
MSSKKNDFFTRFTSKVSAVLGRPWIFAAALGVLILWGLSGPILGFSDTWQLIINTSTTIITFLMVFIIQNTQNRDNMAMNIKLDVILEKLGVEADRVLKAEDESDKRLERQKKRIQNESGGSQPHSNAKHKRKKSR